MSETAEQPTSEAPVPKWGDPINEERQAQLQRYFNAWDALVADHGRRQGPFDGVALNGADVFWLAEQSSRDEYGEVPNLHLEGAFLDGAHLRQANLGGTHTPRYSGERRAGNLKSAAIVDACLTQTQLRMEKEAS